MTSGAKNTTDVQSENAHRLAKAAARQPPAKGRAADSAAEGGAGRGLVTMADNSSNRAVRRQQRRNAADRAQTLIREICGDLPVAKRIVKCGRIPTGQGNPKVAKIGGRAYMSGLQTCSNVWCCVACSYKIRVKRAAEIAVAVRRHLDNGGGVLHIVVTMPHRAGEALADLWSILSDCWAHVTSGGGWKTFRERYEVLGYIRAAEVTHAWSSGWHPHCHVLLFVGAPMSPCENEEAFYSLRAAIRHRWCNRMADKHDRTMSEEFGIRVDPVKADDADGSGRYLTKVGYELAMTNTKVGRDEGHRTPFAIAHDAAETGDMADINLFREWVQASHRKRSISWSNGLREALGLGPERSDEELATEDPDGETVAEIDRNLWRAIADRRDSARAKFLAAFEHEDPETAVAQALQVLHGLGINAVIREASPYPFIGLDHPPPITTMRRNHHVEHQTH